MLLLSCFLFPWLFFFTRARKIVEVTAFLKNICYYYNCASFTSCRFSRVGSVVLAIHDASDVFLEVGKMSKYTGAEGVASVAFVLFVLSWIILRLIYYPFWILWSTRSADIVISKCVLLFYSWSCLVPIWLSARFNNNFVLRKLLQFLQVSCLALVDIMMSYPDLSTEYS